MSVTIHCIAEGPTITCPPLQSGANLLRRLNQERLVLTSVKPLESGGLLRAYRAVQRDNVLYDLGQYRKTYSADHQFLARIRR